MIYISHPLTVQRNRRLLWVTPLLSIPFITLAFVALGGGRGNTELTSKDNSGGLNPKLPEAQFKKIREKNKLGLYEEALRDSARIREEIKIDPYYHYFDHLRGDSNGLSSYQIQTPAFPSSGSRSKSGLNGLIHSPGIPDADSNAGKIMQRLALLQSELNKKPGHDNFPGNHADPPFMSENPELGRLENLVQSAGTTRSGDPELDKLNGMLEKILMIQHPEKIRDSINRNSVEVRESYKAVKAEAGTSAVTVLDAPGADDGQVNGFYGIEEESLVESFAFRAIEAAVDETQTLVSGGVVKIRLLEDIQVRTIRIPANSLVYGISSLNNERLKIAIRSIRYNDQILPVSLEAYDLDGVEGIYVPGSITRDVAKQSTDQALGNLGVETLDPSLQAQAANAGIQAAKMLMSKKIRLVRVTLKAGYHVLLRDTHPQN
jgi:conjugative transposon TraM protein